ncbi:hypothetical protein HMPREF9628_00582 [Peptoanaerobacter stomatis]|uniref:PAS domain S-box protein n=1 Tax=Peptoanaerobacter stomatis TaxID=796937 RepID=G9XF80_9FIRM|nr:PAS domain-containing protein [Peptoanaerobacter stomatis]EHL17472.1 hypothetical protein HMPREF9628_00582 [Peptoanaerobacter stomatis]
MEKRGFDKLDHAKLDKLITIKVSYLKGEISKEEARKQIMANYKSITADEFAYTEQKIKDLGFSDETVHEHMDELLNLLEGILEKSSLSLPIGHPLQTYINENTAIKNLLSEMKEFENNPFDKDKWTEFYNKLYQFNIHLSRKQNQLFSKLEEKGFDRPSKIMWTFDNNVKKLISTAKTLLEEDKYDEFLKLQTEVRESILDLIDKEESILYPTSFKLISEEEFIKMRKGDDEIGYCLIENPPIFGDTLENKKVPNEFMSELTQLLEKYSVSNGQNEILDVKQGKLTLEQINLIFQHLSVDLSYVDENELVRFYSDTKHRVFPRSPGVIGRNVMNCHPRESVDTVKRIIEAFRNGEQDMAEFWLQMNGKFIYITYTAVRDANGKFKGVLEMMQDATHIRSLEGNKKLLSWDDEHKQEDKDTSPKNSNNPNPYGITKDSVIADIINKYPYIREFMPTLSPKYSKILNPIAFNTIGKVANLEMIAQRGNINIDVLISKICDEIKNHENNK